MKIHRLLAAVVIILLLALVPNIAGPYLTVLIMAGIMGIVVVGLDLIIGYTGQLALGHTAFYAIGAYSSGVLVTKLDLPPLLAMALGVIVTWAVAFVVGAPTLRLRGAYFGVATLSFAVIVVNVATGWQDITGGAGGLRYIPRFSVGDLTITSDRDYFYLTWGILAVIAYLAHKMLSSRPGRALKAIHDDEVAAQALGVNLFRYKIQVFALSAAFASIAGSLYAHFVRFVAPPSFDLEVLIVLLLMLFLGGQRTLWGGVLGAVVVKGLPEVVGFLQDFSTLAYGLIFLGVLFFLPQGIAGAIAGLARKSWRAIASGRAAEVASSKSG